MAAKTRKKAEDKEKTGNGYYGDVGQFRVMTVCDGPPDPVYLDSPKDVLKFWQEFVVPSSWYDPEKEQMVVVIVTTRNRLRGWNLVSVGCLNETTAHPREVLRPVIVYAGYGFLIVHNHPSGDPSPGVADREFTERIAKAAELLQLRMHDHVIIGHRGNYFSFLESGMMFKVPTTFS